MALVAAQLICTASPSADDLEMFLATSPPDHQRVAPIAPWAALGSTSERRIAPRYVRLLVIIFCSTFTALVLAVAYSEGQETNYFSMWI